MRKTLNILLVIGTALIVAMSAGAQMMGGGPGMMDDQIRQSEEISPSQTNEPYMAYPGFPNCYGMGPGMMGGYGMMMGGYGMGHGMMGGYGMGPGMMGSYGMGYRNRHMMDERGWGHHGMHRFGTPEKYEQFMEETKGLRKKLHDMRFEYGEMTRDPKTTIGDLKNKQEEMFKLQQEIYEKYEKQ